MADEEDTDRGLRAAVELLALAAERWPTSPRATHHLTLKDGTLTLILAVGKSWHSVGLDEEDLRRSPAEILDQAAALVRRASALLPQPPKGS